MAILVQAAQGTKLLGAEKRINTITLYFFVFSPCWNDVLVLFVDIIMAILKITLVNE